MIELQIKKMLDDEKYRNHITIHLLKKMLIKRASWFQLSGTVIFCFMPNLQIYRLEQFLARDSHEVQHLNDCLSLKALFCPTMNQASYFVRIFWIQS